MFKGRDVALHNPVTCHQIRVAQSTVDLIIPSDYVCLLLATDGIDLLGSSKLFADTNFDGVDIVRFHNLQWLTKEREYALDEEEGASYHKDFIEVACANSQDSILLGYTFGYLNKVYWYDYNFDEVHYIAPSIFEFIENNLVAGPK